MIGGVHAGVGTQLLYGLVTLRFGLPPERRSGSGVLYHNNWVISVSHLDNGLDVVASFYGESQHQSVTNNRNNIVHVGDRIMLVKLPSAFNPRGPDVVSRVTLNRDTSSLVGRELLCIGRGDSQYDPSGVPGETTGDNRYRRANFKVTFDTGIEFDFRQGPYGEVLCPGDSGAGCFSDSDFTLIGLHDTSNWTPNIPSRIVLNRQIAVAQLADRIDEVCQRARRLAPLRPFRLGRHSARR